MRERRQRGFLGCRMAVATLILLCALVSTSALSLQTAQARVIHPFSSQITEGLGPFRELNSMTVGSGSLWVSEKDFAQPRTERFNASTGAFELQFEQIIPQISNDPTGIAVSTGEKQVYVSYFGKEVAVFDGSSGSVLGRWNGADTSSGSFGGIVQGIAIDNDPDALSDPASGDVYVAATQQHVVDVFEPEIEGKEKFITSISEAEPGEPFNPEGITVDEANGLVFVVDENSEGHHFVDVFEPTALDSYTFVRKIVGIPTEPFGNSPLSIAVGASEGDLDIADERALAVDQFTLTGGFLGRITGIETPGGLFGGQGARLASVAVDPSSHRVFVGDRHELTSLEGQSVIDVFGPGVVVPDVTTGSVSDTEVEDGKLRVTLHGTVNPLKEGGSSCQFVWGTNDAFGETTACAGTPPQVAEGSNPVSVSAKLSGLEPDTNYFYQLRATNKNGTNHGEEEPTHSYLTPGPGLHGEWASEVASNSATLNATVDPNGASTEVYFQYGTANCAESGSNCTNVPITPESIGSGMGDINVSPEHVQGLLTHTTYHYRVIVVSTLELSAGKSEVQVFDGPDQTFMTQVLSGASNLPDGRAWELVSPANKNGALIFALNQDNTEMQASTDGSAITYATRSPTETNALQGYSFDEQVLSRRGADGWSTCDLGTLKAVPEGVGFNFPDYPIFSPDLSTALVEQHVFDAVLLSSEASERTPYSRTQSGCGEGADFQPLVTGKAPFSDVPPDTRFGGNGRELGVQFVGVSKDLRHVVVRSRVALTNTSTNGKMELYEWSAEKPIAERLQLVSALPSPSDEPAVEATNVGSDSGIDEASDGRNAVSDDGTRVFWPSSSGGLYMTDTAKEETIELLGHNNKRTGEGATFQIATGDGSRVFFTEDSELYECEIVAEGNGDLGCHLTDLAPQGSVAQDVLGISEDGSYVYFVVDSSLYVYHGGKSKLIATLSSEDGTDAGAGAGQHQLGFVTAAVSSSGHFVAFMSNRSLTGYDNRDVISGVPDGEVFLYDAFTERLVCTSCNPTGARPLGLENSENSLRLVSIGQSGQWYAASIPGWTKIGPFGESVYQSRYLSNNGRLFFNSSDSLVPQDIDGTEDVYQYEPAGVGDCVASDSTFNESEDGCIGLISSGASPVESAFLDASATGGRDSEGGEGGGNVFFLTDERLVGKDVDGSYDVYDAHECSVHVPCASEAAVTPECSNAGSCRGAPATQPSIYGPPPSSMFSGTGNVAAPTSGKPVVKPRAVTRAQKLARALSLCRKKKSHSRRVACEHAARKLYRPKRSSTTGTKRKRGR